MTLCLLIYLVLISYLLLYLTLVSFTLFYLAVVSLPTPIPYTGIFLTPALFTSLSRAATFA